MRTHAEIIRQHGATEVIERAQLSLSLHTVRSWQQRDGIPAEHWLAIAAAGLTTLEELAHAAAAKPRKPVAANDASPRSAAA